MSIIDHAKSVAANIIANQNGTLPQSITIKEVIPPIRKKTKTMGPDTQIYVSPTNPATIISEDNPGGLNELVVISPSPNFSIYIVSNGQVKLDKTYTELSSISKQAEDIAAFRDISGNYILNIKDYVWQGDLILILRSTSGNFIFDQVYANYYVYGE